MVADLNTENHQPDIAGYQPPTGHSMDQPTEEQQQAMGVPVNQRQNAFHALGTDVSDMSVDQALEHANMRNWNVRTIPHSQIVELEDGTTTEVRIPNMNTVLRTNPFNGRPEALGAVGNRWTPFQNEQVAGLCQNLNGMAGLKPASYGVMGNGRKTFMSMKFPEGFEFQSPRGTVDVTDLYLTVFNSHDGFGSLSANITPVRPFCCNQQRSAESMATTRWLLRHTGESEIRIAQLEQMLNESLEYHDKYRQATEAQIEYELDQDAVLRELNQLLHANDLDLTERQREIRQDTVATIRGIYDGSETVAPFHGTAYGLLNAITEYTDHYMGIRVPDGRNEREVRALRTLNNEDLDRLKQRAFTQLLPADAKVLV